MTTLSDTACAGRGTEPTSVTMTNAKAIIEFASFFTIFLLRLQDQGLLIGIRIGSRLPGMTLLAGQRGVSVFSVLAPPFTAFFQWEALESSLPDLPGPACGDKGLYGEWRLILA